MNGVSPGILRSAPAGTGTDAAPTGVDATASRDAVAAEELPPRTPPTQAAAAPTAPPSSQRREGPVAAPAPEARTATERRRNHRPTRVPSSVGTASSAPAPGRERTAATPTAPRTA